MNDRLDTPEKPAERQFVLDLYHFDGYITRSITDAMDVRDPKRARNINSLGEVPDSTWFENRIGVRDVTVEELRRGPDEGDGPEAHKPWTITSTKVGGASVGFLMKDAQGQRYLLKFDPKGHPEKETGAHMIAHRLLWAAGYHVPEDRIVHFTREDLVLADDASIKDVFGNRSPLTVEELEKRLARVNREPGKPIRGMVSEFLPGIPIGGYARRGVRKDDPNDLVPHELRRDVRGLRVLASWLGHSDIKESNTLDIWYEDPDRPGKHHVRHYLIDFGKSLGGIAAIIPRQASGFSYALDWGVIGRSLVSLGLWKRPWEDVRISGIRGVGAFDSEHFSPGEWHQEFPYRPFDDMDARDAFWGARLVMRFTREQIRAAVEEAQYSDPAATEYLTRVLYERQQKIGRYWFSVVNPLDGFTIGRRGHRYELCFDDLLLSHGLGESAVKRRYFGRAFDHDGQRLGWKRFEKADEHGHACLGGFEASSDHDDYTIVQIYTYRGDEALDPIEVHLARDPSGVRLRIIGVYRLCHSL